MLPDALGVRVCRVYSGWAYVRCKFARLVMRTAPVAGRVWLILYYL